MLFRVCWMLSSKALRHMACILDIHYVLTLFWMRPSTKAETVRCKRVKFTRDSFWMRDQVVMRLLILFR